MLIAVASMVGSPGVTTLAAAIAKESGGVLWEADPTGGCLGQWWGPSAEVPTIREAVASFNSTARWKEKVSEVSGIRCVPAPDMGSALSDGTQLTEHTYLGQAAGLCRSLSREEGVSVADLGRLTRLALCWAVEADGVVLVTPGDAASTWRTARSPRLGWKERVWAVRDPQHQPAKYAAAAGVEAAVAFNTEPRSAQRIKTGRFPSSSPLYSTAREILEILANPEKEGGGEHPGAVSGILGAGMVWARGVSSRFGKRKKDDGAPPDDASRDEDEGEPESEVSREFEEGDYENEVAEGEVEATEGEVETAEGGDEGYYEGYEGQEGGYEGQEGEYEGQGGQEGEEGEYEGYEGQEGEYEGYEGQEGGQEGEYEGYEGEEGEYEGQEGEEGGYEGEGGEYGGYEGQEGEYEGGDEGDSPDDYDEEEGEGGARRWLRRRG